MKRALALFLSAVFILAFCACGLPGMEKLPELPPLPTLPAAEEPEAPAAEPQADQDAAPRADVVLDVVILARGPDTREFFLASGADGASYTQRFEAASPGVRLRLDVVEREELPSLLADRIAHGEAPDIVCLERVSDLPSEELLLPAAEYCPEELLADLYPAFLTRSADSGAIIALPVLSSARALYVHTAPLEEAGAALPADWDALEAACRAIAEQEGELIPFGLDMSEEGGADSFAVFAFSNGGGFTYADGGWRLNSPENAEALAFAVELANEGLSNLNPAAETQEGLQALFAAGELAMLPASERLYAALSGQDGSSDLAVVPFPAGRSGERASVGSADCLAVLRDDAAADSAARGEAIACFLRFFYAPGNCAAWARLEGALPASRSAAMLWAEADPALAAWPEILEECRPYPPDDAEWPALSRELVSLEQLCLIGGDFAAGLDALQAEFEDRI